MARLEPATGVALPTRATETSWARDLLQLALAGVGLVAATAGGAILLAIAENGNA